MLERFSHRRLWATLALSMALMLSAVLVPGLASAQGRRSLNPANPPWPPVDAPPRAPGPPVTLEKFREALDPHGRWVRVGGGQGHAWIPDASTVGEGWKPFTRGHWEMTEYGWTWISEFSWGWAPFHYGTWVRHSNPVGWAWVPGTVWSPAWVEFRWGGGHVGWAAGGATGAAKTTGKGTPSAFTFVPAAEFGSASPGTHAVAPEALAGMLRRATNRSLPKTRPASRVALSAGPAPEAISRLAGEDVFIPQAQTANQPSLLPPAAAPPAPVEVIPGRPPQVVNVLRGVTRTGRPIIRKVVVPGTPTVVVEQEPERKPPTPLVIEVPVTGQRRGTVGQPEIIVSHTDGSSEPPPAPAAAAPAAKAAKKGPARRGKRPPKAAPPAEDGGN
jgi:hypothetical protein